MGADDDEHEPGRAKGEENIEEVLASIRALVSAETTSRIGGGPSEAVLVLAREMRVEAEDADEDEDAGSGGRAQALPPAPILDEEAIRALVNRIVREELQAELGERIARNLRKAIRREIAQMEEERRSQTNTPSD